MSITGEPGGPPVKAGVSIIDFAGGYAAALGLVSALLEAKSTGVGRDVDVSLLDTAISMLTYFSSWQLNSNWEPTREPNSSHQTLVPAQNFQTSDGWIAIFCAKEHFWRNLAELIGMPHLIEDQRFNSFKSRYENRKELVEILSKQLVQKSTEKWLSQFQGRVPAGPVNTIEQALSEKQVHARGLVASVEHPSLGITRQVVSSIATDGSNQALTPGPALGENTDDLLSDLLSLNPDQIKKLRDQGAVS